MKPHLAIIIRTYINIKRIKLKHKKFIFGLNAYPRTNISKTYVFWFLQCIVFASNAITQTAIVYIKNKNEIIIAADSKAGDSSVCKIRPVLNYFFATSGFVGTSNPIFNANEIIRSSFRNDKTFEENIAISISNIAQVFPKVIKKIMNDKKDSVELVKRIDGRDSTILIILFAGKNGSDLIVYQRTFKIHLYESVSFTISEYACGADCEETLLYGKMKEMNLYAIKNPIKQNTVLPIYVKKLIEEAITYNPETVGAPIDILQIPRIGIPRWIQRKPQCKE